MRNRLFYCFFCISCFVIGQTNVTAVYTDHAGLTISNSTSPMVISNVVNQHLLAFRTGTTIWSTGVNNTLLTDSSVTFTPLLFYAMPATVVGTNPNAVIGVGKYYGGFVGTNGCNPAITLPFGTDLSSYLTDGINGLDLSTAIFNVGGTVTYVVSDIDPTSIGDGIPDIIITQTGDVSSSSDEFSFLDENDLVVGLTKSVVFNNVPVVMKPHWKFYSLTSACGASGAGSRDLRILTFDFADLGITSSDYHLIKKFRHKLSSNTDMAFVAYNTISATILPITLLKFRATLTNVNHVEIAWTTATQIDNDYFTIERSQNGTEWEVIRRVEGEGNSTEVLHYQEYDYNPLFGVSYYRLGQTDFNGTTTYTNPVIVKRENKGVQVFPNPAQEYITIVGENNLSYRVLNQIGMDVTHQTDVLVTGTNFIKINIQNLGSGYYLVHCDEKVVPIVVK